MSTTDTMDAMAAVALQASYVLCCCEGVLCSCPAVDGCVQPERRLPAGFSWAVLLLL